LCRIYREEGLGLRKKRTTAPSSPVGRWTYGRNANIVVLDFSRRGKPTDNATVESFNGRFREECLNTHWFESIEDAIEKIDRWRWDYNELRPHRSLKGLTPREHLLSSLQGVADSQA
jgi:putative transposase